MADCRVVNASPLIALAKIGQLGLLAEPEWVLIIAAPVAHEVLRWPAEDPARKAWPRAGAERPPPLSLTRT